MQKLCNYTNTTPFLAVYYLYCIINLNYFLMNTENAFPIAGAGAATASASAALDLRRLKDQLLHPEMRKPDYFRVSNLAEMYRDSLDAKPKRKIGGAFLYENSVTYLFSRTNYGKSILVFQLAYAAATGTSIAACEALHNECPPMKVMVADMELDNQTLMERHRPAFTGLDPSQTDNLLYLHEKAGNKMFIGFTLLDKIEEVALYYGAKLIIIDNISKLIPEALKTGSVTLIIETLDRIRKKTGASVLVIGHTTKIHPKIAIQPVSYFGSSMIQNFFPEISYLDRSRDGSFFLCQAKTKHKECYSDTVPVFTRGEHPVIGLGFNYESLQPISDVQLPFELKSEVVLKKKNLSQLTDEISILHSAGKNAGQIAAAFDVSTRSVYRILEESQAFIPCHK